MAFQSPKAKQSFFFLFLLAGRSLTRITQRQGQSTPVRLVEGGGAVVGWALAGQSPLITDINPVQRQTVGAGVKWPVFFLCFTTSALCFSNSFLPLSSPSPLLPPLFLYLHLVSPFFFAAPLGVHDIGGISVFTVLYGWVKLFGFRTVSLSSFYSSLLTLIAMNQAFIAFAVFFKSSFDI